MFETESQSYYEILDVKPDASQSEIRQAYLRTKAAYSKDSAALYSIFDEHETRKVLESIEQAYLVLSSPEKRKEYDRIHGFLKSSDDRFSAPTKTSAHSFSFAKATADNVDPAQQAAQAVFGAGASEFASARAVGAPENAPTAEAQQTSNTRISSATPATAHENYSTPRTLAEHNSAGPPIEEYSTRAFSTSENRLGIVRRIDLSKPFEKNPSMEDSITSETEFRGEFFRRVREYKCISVEEMAEFTKISRTYLNCIESEEFESLPAPAYLRGFVSQIAKALKVPHDKAAQAYMEHYKKTVLK